MTSDAYVGAKLGRPFARDRAAGVSEQRDLRIGGQPDVDSELNAARTESRVLYPYSGPAAKSARCPSVSGTITVNPWARKTEDPGFDARNGPAECHPAGDRIRRLVTATERVVGGLKRDHLRLAVWTGGLMTDVTLTVGLPV